MIILGLVLLVIGVVFKVSIIWTLGVVAIVVGAILAIVGGVGGRVAGRRYWW